MVFDGNGDTEAGMDEATDSFLAAIAAGREAEEAVIRATADRLTAALAEGREPDSSLRDELFAQAWAEWPLAYDDDRPDPTLDEHRFFPSRSRADKLAAAQDDVRRLVDATVDVRTGVPAAEVENTGFDDDLDGEAAAGARQRVESVLGLRPPPPALDDPDFVSRMFPRSAALLASAGDPQPASAQEPPAASPPVPPGPPAGAHRRQSGAGTDDRRRAPGAKG